ncbi:MAG: flagellar biosynthesis protein FlhF [Pseudomonadota bacterium]
MKIKRFYAKTLREALRQVKQELGADAVILSNNKAESGIELVAAIDYDEKKATTQQPVEKVKKRPIQQPTANSKNPDWLQELETTTTAISTHNASIPQSRGHSASQAITQNKSNLDNQLKSDIVSFSQAKQQRNNKKDPHFSESRVSTVVDSLTNKDNFANIFDHQKINLRERKDQQENVDSFNDIYDYDSQLSTTPSLSKEATYSKPKIKTSKKNTVASRSTHQEKIEWSQDPMLVSMKEEIQSLKDMLQNQMSGLAWGNFNRNNPHRAELLQRFYKLGLKPSISEAILRQINETSSLEQGWKNALSIISKGIKSAQIDIINEGGIVALVGPTGVGKTTSIAKIASRFTLQYGSSDIALVSTDTYRVGAQEQLKTYGQLLQIPVYFANDEQELSEVLNRLKNKRLVLIDTAGMNQRDIRLTEQLSMLKSVDNKIKLFAVLSASAQSSSIYEVAKVLKPYGLDGCIVSKLDESTSLGGILSVIIEQQLPLQYVTDGQKVPEDIHPGRASQLLKRAMGIVRERKDAYDYDDIALSFAGDLLLANG